MYFASPRSYNSDTEMDSYLRRGGYHQFSPSTRDYYLEGSSRLQQLEQEKIYRTSHYPQALPSQERMTAHHQDRMYFQPQALQHRVLIYPQQMNDVSSSERSNSMYYHRSRNHYSDLYDWRDLYDSEREKELSLEERSRVYEHRIREQRIRDYYDDLESIRRQREIQEEVENRVFERRVREQKIRDYEESIRRQREVLDHNQSIRRQQEIHEAEILAHMLAERERAGLLRENQQKQQELPEARQNQQKRQEFHESVARQQHQQRQLQKQQQLRLLQMQQQIQQQQMQHREFKSKQQRTQHTLEKKGNVCVDVESFLESIFLQELESNCKRQQSHETAGEVEHAGDTGVGVESALGSECILKFATTRAQESESAKESCDIDNSNSTKEKNDGHDLEGLKEFILAFTPALDESSQKGFTDVQEQAQKQLFDTLYPDFGENAKSASNSNASSSTKKADSREASSSTEHTNGSTKSFKTSKKRSNFDVLEDLTFDLEKCRTTYDHPSGNKVRRYIALDQKLQSILAAADALNFKEDEQALRLRRKTLVSDTLKVLNDIDNFFQQPQVKNPKCEPEIDKAEAEPEIAKAEAEPEIAKAEAEPEPEIDEAEAEPEIDEAEAEPESDEAEPEPESDEAEPEPESDEAEAEPESDEAEAEPEIDEAEAGPEIDEAEAGPEIDEAEAESEIVEKPEVYLEQPEVCPELEAEAEMDEVEAKSKVKAENTEVEAEPEAEPENTDYEEFKGFELEQTKSEEISRDKFESEKSEELISEDEWTDFFDDNVVLLK